MSGRVATCPSMSQAHDVSNSGVSVLDFTADRCPPCRVMAPVVASLAEEYTGRARFVLVDADRELELAARYGVRSIPTFVVLRDGREVGRVIGSRPRAFLAGVIERALRGEVAIASP